MTEHAKIAMAFAQALVDGEFDKAYGLLSPELKEQFTPEMLRRELYGMFEGYSDENPKRVWFSEEFSHDDFSDKLADDLGWDYVSIEGDDFVEAVTVIVTYSRGKPLIRSIDWGRP